MKMKKTFVLSLTLIASVLFTSCSSSGEKFSSYQCPMKCEGAKTYEKAGTCPVCHMELEGIQ